MSTPPTAPMLPPGYPCSAPSSSLPYVEKKIGTKNGNGASNCDTILIPVCLSQYLPSPYDTCIPVPPHFIIRSIYQVYGTEVRYARSRNVEQQGHRRCAVADVRPCFFSDPTHQRARKHACCCTLCTVPHEIRRKIYR